MYPAAKAAGPTVTVLSPPGDNLMIHAAVEVCRPGTERRMRERLRLGGLGLDIYGLRAKLTALGAEHVG